MIQDKFSKPAQKMTNLIESYIKAYGNISANIIVDWPHNGMEFPEELKRDGLPLGLDLSQITNMDELYDENARELMQAFLAHNNPDFAHYECTASRLVVDQDRRSQRIPTHLRQTLDGNCIPIPGNTDLSDEQIAFRLDLWHAYHHKIQNHIRQAQQRQGHAPYKIGMHTFTKSFNGGERTVELGTYKAQETDFTDIFENILAEKARANGFNFEKDKPYDTRENGTSEENWHRNAGRCITEYGAQTINLEIRSDLLLEPENIPLLHSILNDTISEAVQKHRDLKMDAAPSTVMVDQGAHI